VAATRLAGDHPDEGEGGDEDGGTLQDEDQVGLICSSDKNTHVACKRDLQ